MSFLVFLLLLAFGTLFVCVSIQIRRMAFEGKSPWGHMPIFLVRKLSDRAYVWVCGGIGWILIILGGLLYNAEFTEPGGEFWGAVYFGFLAALYALLWMKNRSLDLKP